MLGFKPGETFLQSLADRGGFEPLNSQRDGFFVSGEQIAIDRDNPRFSETEGEPLFDDDQPPSVRRRMVQRALGDLHAGIETKPFIQALVELKLIEPIDISLRFDVDEQLNLQGLYTVSLDALRGLGDDDALQLFKSGYLQLAYTMNVSLNQIGVLAHLRNQQTLQAPAKV